MRRHIARLLRGIAARLDGHSLPSASGTPLEFVPTKELAEQIRERNDIAVIFWGRINRRGPHWHLDAEQVWRMSPDAVEPVLGQLVTSILSAEGN